jgi:hypothetical protein
MVQRLGSSNWGHSHPADFTASEASGGVGGAGQVARRSAANLGTVIEGEAEVSSVASIIKKTRHHIVR